jgi:hypothetical protein
VAATFADAAIADRLAAASAGLRASGARVLLDRPGASAAERLAAAGELLDLLEDAAAP